MVPPGTMQSKSVMNHDPSQSTVKTLNIVKIPARRLQSAYINANIGTNDSSVPVRILIDTGSGYDAITMSVLDRLQRRHIKYKLMKTAKQPPVAANNIAMAILGDVELDVKIKTQNDESLDLQKVKFTVIPNLSTACIIGIDTLSRLGLSVDGDIIKIAGKQICSITKKNTERIALVDSFKDVNLRNQWALYSSDFQDDVDHYSENNVHFVPVNLSEGTSQELQEAEMQGNLYLVKMEKLDEPPKALEINRENHSNLLKQNDEKKSKDIPNKKYVSDEVIEEMVKKSEFSHNGRTRLKKLLQQYKSIFSTSTFDVGKYTGSPVKLKFKDKAVPQFVPVRRIPFSLRSWLQDYLKEMEEKEIITKCPGSYWNSPLFLVPKKKKGTFRPVSDFRSLNKQLADIYFPVPFLSDLLDELGNSKFFHSVDLRQGFLQIVLDEESTECTAFSALGQTYKYLRLPQGIKVSPLIFQQIMKTMFEDQERCLVYMDDILQTSTDEDEALSDIDKLLKKFKDHGFLLNPEKCVFGATQLDYLGYHIDRNGWRPQQSKIDSLMKMQRPSTVTEVRSYCGMCNFYTHCVPGLQQVLRPLHSLSGKKKFKWNDDAENSFNEARKLLAKAVTLAYPSKNNDDCFFLTTDASEHGWGGCLSQFQKDKGCEVPLSFASGSFSNASTRWPILEKELNAFLRCLKLYDTYLFGRRFCWRTDNRAISYFYSDSVIKRDALKSCSKKLYRWIDYINEFNFSIENHGGSSDVMAAADYLSRKSYPMDHPEINVLNKEHVGDLWLYSGITLADMVHEQEQDDQVKNLTGGYSMLRNKKRFKISMENGLKIVTKNGSTTKLIIVPATMIEGILEFYHGNQHSGIMGMSKAIGKRFFIPSISKIITNFTKKCLKCIQTKSQRTKLDKPVLQTTSNHPWMCISADLIGPFPRSTKNNCYCLVVICNLTRWTEVRPLESKHAQCVADAFVNIFQTRGPPLSCLTDNGKEFANKALQAMFKSFGVNLQFCTPYRPQSNGQCERVNQKLKFLLRLWDAVDNNWDNYIPAAVFCINNEYHRQLNMSPFQALHGWTLNSMEFMKTDAVKNTEITDFDSKIWAKSHSIHMTKMLGQLFMNEVENKIHRHEKLQKIYKESSPDDDYQIPIGSSCLIRFPQAPGMNKLMSNWKGSYRVIKKMDKNVYLVAREDSLRRKFLIHQSRIKVLPDENREIINADGAGTVANADSGVVKKQDVGDQSRKGGEEEDPTVVIQGARDSGDMGNVNYGQRGQKIEKDSQSEKNVKAKSHHAMKLRKRKN